MALATMALNLPVFARGDCNGTVSDHDAAVVHADHGSGPWIWEAGTMQMQAMMHPLAWIKDSEMATAKFLKALSIHRAFGMSKKPKLPPNWVFSQLSCSWTKACSKLTLRKPPPATEPFRARHLKAWFLVCPSGSTTFEVNAFLPNILVGLGRTLSGIDVGWFSQLRDGKLEGFPFLWGKVSFKSWTLSGMSLQVLLLGRDKGQIVKITEQNRNKKNRKMGKSKETQ